MGAFQVPNFSSMQGSAGSSLPPPPDFTLPSGVASAPPIGGSGSMGVSSTGSVGAPSGTGTSAPYGGFSFAAGGALPGSHTMTTPTIDPALTNALLQYLGGNLGTGLPQFNEAVGLPSGGQTAPGSLTAPLNPILQQLQDFMTGKSGPDALPGVLPMWQSEMKAMQQPIAEQTANLREQFGSMGALGSSEFGKAMSDFGAQTSADEMSLLTSATMSSLPSMLSAGMDIQGIDQQAIQNAYNQFMTDLPQNNPLMGDLMSFGQMSQSPAYQKTPSFGESLVQGLMGGAGDILQAGGSALNSALPNLPGWASILLGG